MKMGDFLDLGYYLILAAMVLAILMNAGRFATAITAGDKALNSTLGTLSGSGYRLAA